MSPNDILFYSQIGTLSFNHKRGFLQQQTEVHTHTHRQTSYGERVQIAGVPQLLPPIAQGSPWKRRGDIAGVRRDGGHVQNMMRTNQVSRAHMGTQRLKRRVWGVHLRVLCVCCCSQLGVLVGADVSLTLMPARETLFLLSDFLVQLRY